MLVRRSLKGVLGGISVGCCRTDANRKGRDGQADHGVLDQVRPARPDQGRRLPLAGVVVGGGLEAGEG